MEYALITKSQGTVPKAVRLASGVQPGQEIDNEAKLNGQVIMFPAKNQDAAAEKTFLKRIGTGTSDMTTEKILNESSGESWNR
jgi:bifunctional DNA-binding transcriptional regulator/antitoxin component of YhaV-PrlF toxin-antitoxin module